MRRNQSRLVYRALLFRDELQPTSVVNDEAFIEGGTSQITVRIYLPQGQRRIPHIDV